MPRGLQHTAGIETECPTIGRRKLHRFVAPSDVYAWLRRAIGALPGRHRTGSVRMLARIDARSR